MKQLALTLTISTCIGFHDHPQHASRATAQDMSNGAANFYKSDGVDVQKVTFKNKLGMKVVGNLFVPKA